MQKTTVMDYDVSMQLLINVRDQEFYRPIVTPFELEIALDR